MNYKCYCLWASDIPDASAPHYIVIISDKDPKAQHLVVAVSSIKYKPDGSPKYYDTSCELSVDDIVDENGHRVLNKPSFIRYEYSAALRADELFMKQVFSIYKYKCRISDELLKRIQDGARISKELPVRYRHFFAYF